jgi:hypothetical protein
VQVGAGNRLDQRAVVAVLPVVNGTKSGSAGGIACIIGAYWTGAVTPAAAPGRFVKHDDVRVSPRGVHLIRRLVGGGQSLEDSGDLFQRQTLGLGQEPDDESDRQHREDSEQHHHPRQPER